MALPSDSFIESIARKAVIPAAEVSGMLDALISVIRSECGSGNRVAIPGFGSFEGVKHNEEIVKDLATGRNMLLPPSLELKFTEAANLKKQLNRPAR